jgi:hypothetical protein
MNKYLNNDMNYYTFMTINNLDTTKCYVGISSHNRSNYKGSGVAISKALKELGAFNFTKQILGIFDSIEEAHYWEGFYIKMYKTEVKYGGYNISPKGGTYNGCHSTETLKMMKEKAVGRGLGHKYKPCWNYLNKSSEIKIKKCPICDKLFTDHSYQHKTECCSYSCANKKRWQNPNYVIKMPLKYKKHTKSNINKGIPTGREPVNKGKHKNILTISKMS